LLRYRIKEFVRDRTTMSSTPADPSILIADDDPQFLRIIEHHLRSWGWQVTCAQTKSQLLYQLSLLPPGLLLLDVHFGEYDGLEILREVLAEQSDLKVVILTAFGSIDNAIAAIRFGAIDYLTKPVDLSRLRAVIDHGSESGNANSGSGRAPSCEATPVTTRTMLGESRAMRELRELVDRVASTNSTVLVQGESGTGKELVARALHELSPRHRRPFVPLNVAALPRELVESTLFGHAKGAFTGADRKQCGCCEAADGGTLFLDEIGEMEIGLQAKLLRFLQERTLRRVGESELISVDVRIVTATNRDPAELVRRGLLREDLYYRLNVVPINIPPLRQRREDVPLLARHFTQRLTARAGGRNVEFSDRALDELMGHSWPGNVRELENLVERLLIFCTGHTIEASDVVAELHRTTGPVWEPGAAGDRQGNESTARIGSAREPLSPMGQIELLAIKDALASTNGNVREAAKLLGLGQATVYRKIKKYQIL
jgi:two-component system, NtrC family, response regulator HydG